MNKKLFTRKTNRGFAIIDFIDLYGNKCSLQESSLAADDAIWLGVDIDMNGKESSRMHLNREQVESLLPFLQNFIKTGYLDA